MSLATLPWMRGGTGRRRYFLCAPKRSGDWVRAREPAKAALTRTLPELSRRASTILGANGVARFNEFLSYHAGWDFGRGQVLSRNSLLRMEQFLEEHPNFRRRPSLFFTEEGNLALGWEDPADKMIELEFSTEGYTLYLEGADDDVFFPAASIEDLFRTLSSTASYGAP